MKSEQKVVAVGAASGVAAMVLAVWMLTSALHAPGIMDTVADRLKYAIEVNVFALIPFFIMMVTVGNKRFLSAAIDPTRHAENAMMEIDGRVCDNTLQQNFVFFVASLALACIVPFSHLQVILAAALWYVVARVAFWTGYRINPLYRAFGMSGTAYLNLAMICYILYSLS